MRLLVYSHDAFGLGNIRRMLAICEHLLSEIDDLSILLLSGSPMLQGFRLPKGLDYIKLPCLNRGETGNIAVKYLGTDINETVKMRSDLILSAVINYKPDLVLVDKKPYGIQNELAPTLDYLQAKLPQTRFVLLLRDILDTPEKTIAEWHKHSYYEAIEKFYDRVLVVGMPEVFNLPKEYQFPAAVAQKVQFCGYIRKPPGDKQRDTIREELQLATDEQLVLVTPGGGEDGHQLIDTYLTGLKLLTDTHRIKSLIICGPEMPTEQKQALYQIAKAHPQVQIEEFTDDLMSYMTAADAVVSMGGYNTVCEILSARKPAVVVPRIKPSQEQFVRSQKMQQLGLFKVINPEHLTPTTLIQELQQQLENGQSNFTIDLEGLPRITHQIRNLLADKITNARSQFLYSKLTQPYSLIAVQNS
ncbi:MAG: glycosyltransferase [Fischerella sp.]|uniref:glycosyltransferase family protein n=1 Tax=Fischerella sp. TaxID=1191 RepID=UPI0017B3E028|nr:glycosyltransferase [Fischerella sp.]NWF61639.1 glycosyltransferase [Fischerella sp.]